MPPAWSEKGRRANYLLGTDDQGRDMLSAIIYGARMSLLVGLASVVLSRAGRRHARACWPAISAAGWMPS